MSRIRLVRIENFRCLKSVELEFEPLTVLVGPNASGKTTLLDALGPSYGVGSTDLWQQRPDTRVTCEGKLEGGAPFSASAQAGCAIDLPWRLLRLQLFPPALRQPNTVQESHLLTRDGGNLANVFGTLPRTVQADLAKRFCELVPLYKDLDVRPGSPGQHRVVFQDKWRPSLWYEPGHVSDGSMVLLAFLTLAHLQEPPDIIVIEEPEHALHPYLLGEVIGMLRNLATGKLGKAPVQVILATHSAELLNFVDPAEVRFLSRTLSDGSTVIRKAPVDEASWKAAFAEYEESMGEVWLSGGLGGVPDTNAAQ